MNQNREIIYYETLHAKVHWRHKLTFEDEFEIIKLEDVWREEYWCYSIEQYIKSFVEVIKERVIRYLPKLEEVHVIVTTFDKNNLLHRLAISVVDMIKKC